MLVGRFIGWFLLAAAAIVLMRDMIAWLDTARFEPISAGTLWLQLQGGGGGLADGVPREGVAPWLWDWTVGPILRGWAVLVLAVPGIALIRVFRRRDGGRRRRRR